MKHPDHSYRGLGDMKNCPDFIADYDCQADYIDKKYNHLKEKVPTSTLCMTSSPLQAHLQLPCLLALHTRDAVSKRRTGLP